MRSVKAGAGAHKQHLGRPRPRAPAWLEGSEPRGTTTELGTQINRTDSIQALTPLGKDFKGNFQTAVEEEGVFLSYRKTVMPALTEPRGATIFWFYAVSINGSLGSLKPACCSQAAKSLVFSATGVGAGAGRSRTQAVPPAAPEEGPRTAALLPTLPGL